MNLLNSLQFGIYVLLLFTVQAIQIRKIPSTGSPPEKRKQTTAAYDSLSDKVFIYGGYLDSVEFTGDFWAFDLKSDSWEEIHSPSVSLPGPRMSSFIHVLHNSQEILLFGGKNAFGPISDMWKFDIKNQMVSYRQWREIHTNGMPISSFRNAVCAYTHLGRDFIATIGGNTRKGFINELYL